MDVQVERGDLSRHRWTPRRSRARTSVVSVDHDWPQERVVSNEPTDIHARRCPGGLSGVTGWSAHPSNVVPESPSESGSASPDPSPEAPNACQRRRRSGTRTTLATTHCAQPAVGQIPIVDRPGDSGGDLRAALASVNSDGQRKRLSITSRGSCAGVGKVISTRLKSGSTPSTKVIPFMVFLYVLGSCVRKRISIRWSSASLSADQMISSTPTSSIPRGPDASCERKYIW